MNRPLHQLALHWFSWWSVYQCVQYYIFPENGLFSVTQMRNVWNVHNVSDYTLTEAVLLMISSRPRWKTTYTVWQCPMSKKKRRVLQTPQRDASTYSWPCVNTGSTSEMPACWRVSSLRFVDWRCECWTDKKVYSCLRVNGRPTAAGANWIHNARNKKTATNIFKANYFCNHDSPL